MEWSRLHSQIRLGGEHNAVVVDNLRHDYLKDYDRLIFSSPFRRLQNKTQVFPLPGHIFVHNRLTHSLEVASVGRSLGQMIGEKISKLYINESSAFYEFYNNQLQTVIATACLAHDLGNPPFGHSGEEAIRSFFEQIDGELKIRFEHELTANQQQDFVKFEGNTNTFRLLTHPNLGLHRLCYTTLATVVKYPCLSLDGFDKRWLNTKKSGFYDSDLPKFEQVAHTLGLIRQQIEGKKCVFARHPFVYLVEAADDICYRLIDLEDAFRLNILSKNELFDLLKNVLPASWLPKVELSLNKQNHENQQLSYLRATVMGYLTQSCVEVFMNYENDLLQGQLNKSLIDLLPNTCTKAIKTIDDISYQKIYNHKSVVETELAGFETIAGLLETFVQAVIYPNRKKSEKLLQLIPGQFELNHHSLYEQLLSIVDFVSGMTDVFAIDLYRKIKGISV